MTVQPSSDVQTVTPSGERLMSLIEGVKIRSTVTHPDDRGTLAEIYDLRWNFHDAPLVFIYEWTIRPGIVKGWGIHEHHDDRYFLSRGTIKTVLYDNRPTSPTYRQINEIYMSDYNRGIVSIPAGVYHATQNIGTTDAFLLNMPTQPYNHERPDKARLPVENDVIPYSFAPSLGG